MTPTLAISISAVATALTQHFKDLGIQGQWLKVVCIAVGAAASYLAVYQPALWSQLTPLLLGTTATGGVSFLKDMVSGLAPAQPSGE